MDDTIRLILAAIFSVVFLPIYVYAILLFFGKGGSLLAGYHTSGKKTTAKKEHKYITRKASIFMLISIVLTHAMVILFIYSHYIWGIVMAVLLIKVLVIGFYLLNNKKMQKIERIIKASKINEDTNNLKK